MIVSRRLVFNPASSIINRNIESKKPMPVWLKDLCWTKLIKLLCLAGKRDAGILSLPDAPDQVSADIYMELCEFPDIKFGPWRSWPVPQYHGTAVASRLHQSTDFTSAKFDMQLCYKRMHASWSSSGKALAGLYIVDAPAVHICYLLSAYRKKQVSLPAATKLQQEGGCADHKSLLTLQS